MNLKLAFFGALCETSIFKINGVLGDSDDFGDKYDHDSANAQPYGCGDMRFESKPPTDVILRKYNISVDEYNLIAEKLTEGLSFGNCGWCV